MNNFHYDNITHFFSIFSCQVKQPLFGMQFLIIGATKKSQADIIHKIRLMGGKMATKIHRELAAVISNSDEVNRAESDIKDAFLRRIQVVSEDFLDKVMDNDPIDVIVKSDLSKWGRDVSLLAFICILSSKIKLLKCN